LIAPAFHLANPAFDFGAIVGRDVLLFVQILAQIRHGRLGPAEIVVASAQVAHEDRHARVVDAQLEENLRGLFVVSRLVELGCLFRVGRALLVHARRGSLRRERQWRSAHHENG